MKIRGAQNRPYQHYRWFLSGERLAKQNVCLQAAVVHAHKSSACAGSPVLREKKFLNSFLQYRQFQQGRALRMDIRKDNGAAMVEAAIGLTIFISLLFMLVSLFLVFFVQSILKISINDAASLAVRLPLTPPQTREMQIQQAALGAAQQLGLSVASSNIQICPLGQVCLTLNAGSPNQLIQIKVRHQLFQLPILGAVELNVESLVRNPPYFAIN